MARETKSPGDKEERSSISERCKDKKEEEITQMADSEEVVQPAESESVLIDAAPAATTETTPEEISIEPVLEQVEPVATPAQNSDTPTPEPEVVSSKPVSAESSGEAVQEQVSSQPEPVALPELTKIPESVKSPTVKEVVKEVFVYKPTLEMMQTLQKKSLEAIQKRRRGKIEKLMAMFEKEEKITSADVQQFLIVSHTTALRYLDTLEQEGRIRQVGKRGGSVHYVRI